jgi:hypothetical protein
MVGFAPVGTAVYRRVRSHRGDGALRPARQQDLGFACGQHIGYQWPQLAAFEDTYRATTLPDARASLIP